MAPHSFFYYFVTDQPDFVASWLEAHSSALFAAVSLFVVSAAPKRFGGVGWQRVFGQGMAAACIMTSGWACAGIAMPVEDCLGPARGAQMDVVLIFIAACAWLAVADILGGAESKRAPWIAAIGFVAVAVELIRERREVLDPSARIAYDILLQSGAFRALFVAGALCAVIGMAESRIQFLRVGDEARTLAPYRDIPGGVGAADEVERKRLRVRLGTTYLLTCLAVVLGWAAGMNLEN